MEARTAGNGCLFGGLEKLCKEGQLREAFQTVDRLGREGYRVPDKVFYALLKRCIHKEDLAAGKELHRLILRSGVDVRSFLGSHLIRMFASCGSLLEASHIFERLPKPNVFSWSAILSAHVMFGKHGKAISLYHQMHHSDVRPDGHVFVAALKACGGGAFLLQGELIHTDILESGFDSALHVVNAVVDMYCKCGSMANGLKVFDRLPKQDLVTWNTMISGYVHHGYYEEALDFFQQMPHEGMKPNITTWNTMISGYAQKGEGHEALRLLHAMKQGGIEPNSVTWNALIGGYAQHGLCENALNLYQQMQEEGSEPDYVTFLCILRASSKMETFEKEMQDQAIQLIEACSTHGIISGSSPVDMARSSPVDMARSVFNKLQRRPVKAWNAMIAAYAEQGNGLKALHLFKQMQQEGIQPNNVTFVSTLKACSGASNLDQGKLMHAAVVESGFDMDTFIGSTLIDTYAKCGSLSNARTVFDCLLKRDVVAWTVMIAGYTQHGHNVAALDLFDRMQWEGIEPNRVTFLFLLKVCSSVAALDLGRLGHALITMSGWELDAYVGSTLIYMYAKCERFKDAQLVFDNLPTQLPVAWNVMIVGCAQCGQSQEALQLFQQMQQAGIEPNQATYVSIFKTCSTMLAPDQGKLSHASFIEAGFNMNAHVSSALVDMYAKCGSIEDAYEVFVGLPMRDVAMWNAMIAGYAQIGDHEGALQCFEDLQREGVKADAVTFVCLLSVCSHMGFKDKGRSIFLFMIQDEGIVPTLEHYNCMIHLLGNAGLLNEAEDFLYSMPLTPNIVGWTSLLRHCGRQIDVERGKRCFNQVSSVDDTNGSSYKLMSNIYAHSGILESVDHVEDARKCPRAWKKSARAFIEVENSVHSFIGSHLQSDNLYLLN